MDWTEKYRPTSLSELRGNDSARDDFREWADTWEDHREAVIVHGSPGVGKTSAAHALAADVGWDRVELNASDSRTKDDIQRLAGRASRNATLGGADRQLIVVDEADNFHGNADRGGSRAVTDIVKAAGQPIVLIANDYYEMSNALRNACRKVEFRDVSARSIVPVLRDICRKEDIDFEEEALEAIAEMNSGDLRGAIKDLQAQAEGKAELTAEDVVTGERDRTRGVFDYLDTVIKEADAQEALEASYAVDETPDDLVNWIEDNVPKDYHGEELADAYGFLANADRWLGRVRATQNYSFWRYAADNMTAGVAAARREEKGGWTRYGPPSYWSKLGRTRGTRDKRDYVARRVAEHGGVSTGTARREILPHLAVMTHHCKNRELTVAMAARYELEAEHVAFVTGSGKDTNKVQSIVEDARQLREELAANGAEDAFGGRSDADGDADDGGTDDTETGAGAGTDTGSQASLSGTGESERGRDGDDVGDGDGNEEDVGDGAGSGEDGEPEERADDDQQAGLSDFV